MADNATQLFPKFNGKSKTLILGVGNPILGDDGIGIHVLRELEQKYSDNAHIEFDEMSTGGLSLAERFIGYEKVVLIDALAFEGGKPGVVHKLSINDLQSTVHTYCAHDCNLATAYNILKEEIGSESLPYEVIIIGIEINKINEFSESLTPKVKKAIPLAIAQVEKEFAHIIEKK